MNSIPMMRDHEYNSANFDPDYTSYSGTQLVRGATVVPNQQALEKLTLPSFATGTAPIPIITAQQDNISSALVTVTKSDFRSQSRLRVASFWQRSDGPPWRLWPIYCDCTRWKRRRWMGGFFERGVRIRPGLQQHRGPGAFVPLSLSAWRSGHRDTAVRLRDHAALQRSDRESVELYG